MNDDLTLAEAGEVGRIMARDGISAQDAIDHYFGTDGPGPRAVTLPDGTQDLILRRYEQEMEERER